MEGSSILLIVSFALFGFYIDTAMETKYFVWLQVLTDHC